MTVGSSNTFIKVYRIRTGFKHDIPAKPGILQHPRTKMANRDWLCVMLGGGFPGVGVDSSCFGVWGGGVGGEGFAWVWGTGSALLLPHLHPAAERLVQNSAWLPMGWIKISRATFHVHSFQEAFCLENLPKTRGTWLFFEKADGWTEWGINPIPEGPFGFSNQWSSHVKHLLIRPYIAALGNHQPTYFIFMCILCKKK